MSAHKQNQQDTLKAPFVKGVWGEKWLKSPNHKSPASSQSGFTLIECLLAIIIVAILLSAVAPAIILATATRLQARRVELASQAAKAYVDGVRTGKIPAYPIASVTLDEAEPDADGKKVFVPKRTTFAQTAPPAISDLNASNCLEGPEPYPYCSGSTATLYCVDMDGGGCKNTSPRDFIVQAFRSQSTEQAAQEATAGDDNAWNRIITRNGFVLGVRVYRADSFKGTRALSGGDRKKDTTFTGGTGLKDTQAPLVELMTEISSRNSSGGTAKDTTSRAELCARLGGCDPGTPTPSPSP